MLTIRRAKDRGHADHGWLDTNHTFSFADYYDPAHMGFRALRVINEDRVVGGKGFGAHGHRDMEILSYVLEGALEHKDSMGSGSVIRPGDVQRMSAGTGVMHSEQNHSKTDPVHFLQIWLMPAERDLPPSYEQKSFSYEEKLGLLRVVASPDARDGSLQIHTDAVVRAGLFEEGQKADLDLDPARHAWVQIAKGRALVNGKELFAGDGAAISREEALHIEGIQGSEILVIDLA